MRRIILVGFLSLLTIATQASVRSFFDFSAGGGWSTLTYSLSTPDARLSTNQNGSYGLTFHVGYGMMFNSYVGLGLGVDMSRYGANASMKGEAWWYDVTDTDGEKYNHCATVNAWNDRQELYYVEVPLTLYLNIPTGSAVSVSAELGVKYAYPFVRNTSYNAEITHFGQYPLWGMTLTDMPNHGFTTNHLIGGGHFAAQHQVIGFAKIGILMPINDRLSFFAHVYGTYGFRKAFVQTGETQELGFREESDELHSFMPSASSLLLTNMPSGSFRPASVGVEIGLRVYLKSRRNSHCMCLPD